MSNASFCSPCSEPWLRAGRALDQSKWAPDVKEDGIGRDGHTKDILDGQTPSLIMYAVRGMAFLSSLNM